MKVKFTRTIGKQDTLPKSQNENSLECPCKEDGSCYREGEVADLKKEIATVLLERCLVEHVEEAKETKEHKK